MKVKDMMMAEALEERRAASQQALEAYIGTDGAEVLV